MDALQLLRPKAWIRAIGLVLLAASAAMPAWAANFTDLYTLTVTLDDAAATSSARDAAVQTAMRRLLERVTGDRGAALDPGLANLVEDAGSYVRSYATLGGGRVQVGFIPSKIDHELASMGKPVWGPERPLTLLWIAVDGGHGERTLLSADGGRAGLSPQMTALTDTLVKQVNDVADERGLPVLLPLLDLEDLNHIAFADVWGGFDERILQASARYGADAVLVGRVLETPLGTNVQWTLLRGSERRVTSGESVAEGLEWLADQYAQEFSVVGGQRTLRIVVKDVRSLADYGRVMSYLGGVSALQSIDVEGLAKGVLTLRVGARGGIAVLMRTFSLSHVLQPAAGLENAETAGAAADNGSRGNPAGGTETGTETGPETANGLGTSTGQPGESDENTLVLRVARSGDSP